MLHWTLCALVAISACGPRLLRPGVAPDVAVTDPNVVRFVAVGDTGHGNDIEYAVARSIETTCAARGGCQLALLLGDNIYRRGLESADDPQAVTKFERPFAVDAFPFYGVLGNHDYGMGWEFWRAAAELDYAAKSKHLVMPSRHYTFGAGPVDFFAIDTNALFWGADGDEEAALELEQADSRRPWKVVFGHHPYLSNGKHGNAGAYEGLPGAWLPAAGGAMRTFVERHICGKADVYLSGHDHSLQDLGDKCGTQFAVSGAGSEATVLNQRNPSLFQAAKPGFLLVEVAGRKMKLTFIDAAGHELHSREISK